VGISKRILPALVVLAAALVTHAEARQGSSEAGVPSALVKEVSARAAERGVPAADVLAPVAEAAERGVPPELVAAKVLEGLSKGVPAPRISAVARDFTGRLAGADAVLRQAQRAGLTPAADRKAALLDLASVFAAGVRQQTLEALIEAAHQVRGGSAEAVVSAAHVVGELARRGVPAEEAVPVGMAIARHGARPRGEIPALFDAWRAEGGKDANAFTAEAAYRIESGRKLDGLVDVFGESPDRVAADRKAGKDPDRGGLAGSDVGKHGADQGLGPGERADQPRGAVPGFDEGVRNKGKRPKQK
jgi:hypothetical protein